MHSLTLPLSLSLLSITLSLSLSARPTRRFDKLGTFFTASNFQYRPVRAVLNLFDLRSFYLEMHCVEAQNAGKCLSLGYAKDFGLGVTRGPPDSIATLGGHERKFIGLEMRGVISQNFEKQWS